MPCKGFVCPLTSGHVGLDTWDVCPSPCIELPILYALLEKERVVNPNRFSITEILKPPQVLALERAHDYWTDPMDLVWSTFGTSWHSMIESQKKRLISRGITGYSFEYDNRFEVPFDVDGKTVMVHGTPDQYFHPTDTLTDYKTLKYYWDVYYLQRGKWSDSHYGWQVNMYRRFRFPSCKHMQLVALIKDYNRKLRAKCGVSPIVKISVPFIKDAEVDEFVRARLRDHLIAESDITKARECTLEERWKDSLRCFEYCPCNVHCRQFQERGRE
jgi:hypothetical protein